MKKYFLNNLIDSKYISIFIIGILILYLSIEPVFNLIIEYLTTYNESFYLTDIYENIVFPISLKNFELLFISIGREVIFYVSILYPIAKIVDAFFNYNSSILFTKIERKTWVKQTCILIIIYVLVLETVLCFVDVIGFSRQISKLFINYKIILLYLLKYILSIISFFVYLVLSIKMNDNSFAAIISIITYLILSIMTNNIFLPLKLSYFFLITIVFLFFLLIMYKICLILIEKKDLGGI